MKKRRKSKAWGIFCARFSTPNPCKSLEHSKEFAELAGILLGDGNVYVYENGRTQVHQVRIASGRKTEEEYARGFVAPLLTNLSGINSKFLLKRNVIYSCINSKEFVKELERNGMRRGDKIKNKVGIPAWISADDEFLRACIRGLIDTDGSVYRLSNKDPHLGRISFKNFNSVLMDDFRKGLIKLGFHPSKEIYKNVHLTRKADVLKYYKEIGSNNPYKLARLEKFV